MKSSQEAITQLLHELRDGRQEAFDELLPQVYDELGRIARLQRRRERDDHTLDTTALVHEVYLRLVGPEQVAWQDRAHFYAVAARAMRQILISYARRRNAEKRGGGALHLSFNDELGLFMDGRDDQLVALDEVLQVLEKMNPRLGKVIECRFFAGLTIEETAEALDVSPATVTRDWRLARAWLTDALGGKGKKGGL